MAAILEEPLGTMCSASYSYLPMALSLIILMVFCRRDWFRLEPGLREVVPCLRSQSYCLEAPGLQLAPLTQSCLLGLGGSVTSARSCHCLTVAPWASPFPSVCLYFLICKLGVMLGCGLNEVI